MRRFRAAAKKRIDIALCLMASVLLPNIFLFFLYDNNRIQNHIPFRIVVVVAIALAIVSFFLLFLLRRVTRCYNGALVVTLLFWLTFWFFEQLYTVTIVYSASLKRGFFLAAITIVLGAIAACFRRYSPSFLKRQQAYRILSIVLCSLFLLNFIPGLQNETTLQMARRERENETGFRMKESFNTDISLQKPDIYWFHMDGMMTLSTVERVFSESQDHLRFELERRGFNLRENAILNAGTTNIALPALFSPTFYDDYYGKLLNELGSVFGHSREQPLNAMLSEDGISLMDDVMPYHELFHALFAVDYEVIIMANNHSGFINSPNSYYYKLYRDLTRPVLLINDRKGRMSHIVTEASDLLKLITITTPLSLISDLLFSPIIDEQWMPVPEASDAGRFLTQRTQDVLMKCSTAERFLYNSLIDALTIPMPKFAFVCVTVRPGFWQEPARSERDWTKLYDQYMEAHESAATVVLRAIDIVLEENPDAVVVLQADHGLHIPETREYMLGLGYTEADVLDLNASVFSAVRIPSQYGELTEPLDPLDISRFLVNSFVGQNYEYLYYPG